MIALHGYGGNKESMMDIARRINDRDAVIASMQGPYQFSYPFGTGGFVLKAGEHPKVGFGWATPWRNAESIALHHRNLLKLIESVAEVVPVDRDKIFLLGFSQPVAMNYRFVFTYPHSIRGVIGVCGGVPGDWSTGPYGRSETEVLHIATENDAFYPPERAKSFEALLGERAASVEFCMYRGGHKFPLRAIPHIAQWLEARIG